MKQAVYTLKENFISREAFQDIQLSCHFAVLLIKVFREKFSHLKVPFSSTGSDTCENFFSKVGGMVRNERSYDGGDLLSSAVTLNRIAEIQSSSLLVFPAAHSKQESIWTIMNHAHGVPLANLGDYKSVSSDEEIIRGLREGLYEAKSVCEMLGMHEISWCHDTWQEEDLEDIFATNIEDQFSNEGDVDDISHEINEDGNELSRSIEDEVVLAECELRHVLDSVVDEEEKIHSQVSPFVEVDGKQICKSTLVSQLNGNPMLSKDRLTRVKSGIYHVVDKNVRLQTGTSLVVGSDCAVLFDCSPSKEQTRYKRKGKICSTNEGVTKGAWYLGRVVCMRRKLGSAMRETRGPIDLLDRPSNVEIHLAWYQKAKGTRSYTYDLVDNQCVSLESIISLANLTYDVDSKKYQLDADDYKVFEEYVKGNNVFLRFS